MENGRVCHKQAEGTAEKDAAAKKLRIGQLFAKGVPAWPEAEAVGKVTQALA